MRKICFLYQGRRFGHSELDIDRKKREIENLKEVKNYLLGGDNQYYFTLTTWIGEDISIYKEILGENLFVNFVDDPSEYQIEEFLKTGRTQGKNLVNYHKQLYLRLNSIETLKRYKEISKTDFDVVVLVRTDTQIWENISKYYDLVQEDDNSVYVADGPNSAVFGTHIHDSNSACPDIMYFSNEKLMYEILDHLSRCEETTTNGMYHPETSQMNFFKLINLNIVRMPFDVFIHPRLGKDGNLEAVHYPGHR